MHRLCLILSNVARYRLIIYRGIALLRNRLKEFNKKKVVIIKLQGFLKVLANNNGFFNWCFLSFSFLCFVFFFCGPIFILDKSNIIFGIRKMFRKNVLMYVCFIVFKTVSDSKSIKKHFRLIFNSVTL